MANNQEQKSIAIIDGDEYKVGFPACQGCEHLCFPGPLTCIYPGDGCEYPDSRKAAENDTALEQGQLTL